MIALFFLKDVWSFGSSQDGFNLFGWSSSSGKDHTSMLVGFRVQLLPSLQGYIVEEKLPRQQCKLKSGGKHRWCSRSYKDCCIVKVRNGFMLQNDVNFKNGEKKLKESLKLSSSRVYWLWYKCLFLVSIRPWYVLHQNDVVVHVSRSARFYVLHTKMRRSHTSWRSAWLGVWKSLPSSFYSSSLHALRCRSTPFNVGQSASPPVTPFNGRHLQSFVWRSIQERPSSTAVDGLNLIFKAKNKTDDDKVLPTRQRRCLPVGQNLHRLWHRSNTSSF